MNSLILKLTQTQSKDTTMKEPTYGYKLFHSDGETLYSGGITMKAKVGEKSPKAKKNIYWGYYTDPLYLSDFLDRLKSLNKDSNKKFNPSDKQVVWAKVLITDNSVDNKPMMSAFNEPCKQFSIVELHPYTEDQFNASFTFVKEKKKELNDKYAQENNDEDY